MAGKIIADIIEAPYDSIRMNVANVTVLTANSSGLTYVPTGNVNINVGSTTSLTLGNVTVSNLLTTNGGIKFPATQVSSSDANTLDDYEEGTWTPGTSAQSGTITINSGSSSGFYTKIGRKVFFTCTITISSVSGASGRFFITNLPFTCSTTHITGSIQHENTSGTISRLMGTISSTTVNIQNQTSTATADYASSVVGNAFFTVTGDYHTST